MSFEDMLEDKTTNNFVATNETNQAHNDYLEEDQRFSRRKRNFKEFFIGGNRNSGVRSTGALSRKKLTLKPQTSLEIDAITDFDVPMRSKKSNTLSKNASTLVAHEETKQHSSKSFNSLLSGVRTWFQRPANSSKDDLHKTSSSNFLMNASICSSSGRKKSQSSQRQEKSSERERSHSSRRRGDDSSDNNSYEHKIRLKKSKKRVIEILIYFRVRT